MNPSATSMAVDAGHGCWLPILQLATQEVFELMLAAPLEIAEKAPSEQFLEVTSMVGLAGRLRGILSVRCSQRSATHMAARMLGTDPETAGPEMWDAVGEICNMVAGNFKNKISGLGDGCMLSVPTVISGADYSIRSRVSENLHAAFLFQEEPFVISLEFYR